MSCSVEKAKQVIIILEAFKNEQKRKESLHEK